jgi:hypothetical protein
MGSVVLNGATSGSTTLTPTDAVTVNLTLPNATGTLLTSSGSISNLAGGSNGTIPYQSASDTTQMLAVGTSGQVLQTNGVGAPSWVTPSSGAMTLIATTTAGTGTSFSFNSIGSYKYYLLIFNSLTATTGAKFGIRVNNITSSYDGNVVYSTNGSTATASTTFGSSGSFVRINGNNVASQTSGVYQGVNGFCYINSGNASTYGLFTTFVGQAVYYNGFYGNPESSSFSYIQNSPNSTSSIQMLVDTGNFYSAGTASLYGISS